MRHLVQMEAVQQFTTAAARYCRTVEAHDSLPVHSFLAACEQTLCATYLAALSLPRVEPHTAETARPLGTERWKQLFDALTSKLGAANFYRLVFDPVDQEDREVVDHSLADDLTGVYEDLKPGLEAWPPERDEVAADIVWEWRFGFEVHWGRHATNALRPIWALLYDRGTGTNQDETRSA